MTEETAVRLIEVLHRTPDPTPSVARLYDAAVERLMWGVDPVSTPAAQIDATKAACAQAVPAGPTLPTVPVWGCRPEGISDEQWQRAKKAMGSAVEADPAVESWDLPTDRSEAAKAKRLERLGAAVAEVKSREPGTMSPYHVAAARFVSSSMAEGDFDILLFRFQNGSTTTASAHHPKFVELLQCAVARLLEERDQEWWSGAPVRAAIDKAVAAEREACAVAAESAASTGNIEVKYEAPKADAVVHGYEQGCRASAAAIRARGATHATEMRKTCEQMPAYLAPRVTAIHTSPQGDTVTAYCLCNTCRGVLAAQHPQSKPAESTST